MGLRKITGILFKAFIHHRLSVGFVCMLVLCLTTSSHSLLAQKNQYTVKNGGMNICITKHQTMAELDSFIKKNYLEDLHLREYLTKGTLDTLKALGWMIIQSSGEEIKAFKPLIALNGITKPENKIIFTDGGNTKIDFDRLKAEAVFGFNNFGRHYPFAVKDSTITFFLHGNSKARKVQLAGTFNNWSTAKTTMVWRDSGWAATLTLSPGKYWYKYIVDGKWIEDPDNQLREPNQYQSNNSVYFVCNYTFRLSASAFPNAKKVFLSGSFNEWKEDEVRMNRTATGWELPVYLAEGTSTYKFIVDGNWTTDPANPNILNDGMGHDNSMLSRGTPYLFKLNGHLNAKDVVLTGNFNGWLTNELHLKRTSGGWQLPYVLRPGIYQYKFIVDGKPMVDPVNPDSTWNGQMPRSSWIIIKPNYTFRLKGYPSAKRVYVTGEFNDWIPNGFPMAKTSDGWTFTLYLLPGKHLYKFVVDGNWILDPDNKVWENNDEKSGNSVIWVNKK